MERETFPDSSFSPLIQLKLDIISFSSHKMGGGKLQNQPLYDIQNANQEMKNSFYFYYL